MNTMKLRYLISMVSIVGLMYGCIDDELFDQTKEATSNEVTVSLNLGGEILVANEAMTRGENDPDIYGIQVYKDGKPFAYGLFDNVNKLRINLLAGSNYKIVTSMVKDGKNLLSSDGKHSNIDNLSEYIDGFTKKIGAWGLGGIKEGPYYYFPFAWVRNGYRYVYSGSYYFNDNYHIIFHYLNNIFIYNDDISDNYLSNRELNTLGYGLSVMSDGSIWKYPETDRFYGEIDNYTPQANGSLTIDMKRTAFGLKCQVTGITDGSVSVKIENDSRVFFENEAITDDTISDEKVFTFANVRDAWLYADNYEEKLRVTVDWLRGIGITENLGTATISVKRNTMNKVRINLGAVDNSSSLSINVEDDAYINNNSIEIPFAQ